MNTYCYRKLRARVIEIFGSQQAFAEACGKATGGRYAENTISRKLNNKSVITTTDIDLFSRLLQIEPVDIPIYFFTKKGA